jgi:hypothetical protein
MMGDAWLEEEYFGWLRSECFSEESERRQYEGVLRVLHDVPFYWTLWSDDNRAGDALAFRQSDFLSFQTDLDRLDQRWLDAWAQASPSVLEVLLGIARRWHYYFEGSIAFYFGHLFLNLELDRFPGKILQHKAEDVVRATLDDWMSRQFHPSGGGSPFPLRHADPDVDMRKVDIWGQMNAYSLEHFQ